VDANGQVAGTGFHTYEGLKHAEVLALEQAGAKARGGTLYLNLEPCCHQGRTGPCTDAVIASGLKRVVMAMADPNPLVTGKGMEKLRLAGITVETGLLQSEARKLNEAFAKYILHKQPLVTLKSGMTLDGKIAPPPGESFNPSALGAGGATGGWITSVEARAHVQELRHASDAIMVGVGTVIADDPLLTDRTGLPRRRPLLRVVLDSRLRLPLDCRLVKTVKNDVLVFCSFAEEKKKKSLEDHGVRVEQVSLGLGDGRPDLQKIARYLGELEITSLLIEGGALVNWTALASGIVDKVFLYYAPKILAGTGSVPFATGAGFKKMTEAALVKNIVLHRFGEDFAVEGYLRDPYEPPPAVSLVPAARDTA
jgi:diaminohydroxyphosphoribosylaminopyrimidine deaminase/5-amino-6-(5-phosphoribosylamino)uracil reductase